MTTIERVRSIAYIGVDIKRRRVIPIARQFSFCPAKNLLICLVFLEPRPSKLAPVRYRSIADLGEAPNSAPSLPVASRAGGGDDPPCFDCGR